MTMIEQKLQQIHLVPTLIGYWTSYLKVVNNYLIFFNIYLFFQFI